MAARSGGSGEAEEPFGIIWHGQILDRSAYKASATLSLGMDPQVQKKGAPRQNSITSETTAISGVQSE